MYLKKVENLNMIYSIDKLRLTTKITYNEFCNLQFHFENAYKGYIKRYWMSFAYSDFKYNYNFSTISREGKLGLDEEIDEEKEATFSIHFFHNAEKNNVSEQAKYNFSIEFNPNKLKDFFLIFFILNQFGGWYIKSYDLAIDIPLNILDLCIPDKR